MILDFILNIVRTLLPVRKNLVTKSEMDAVTTVLSTPVVISPDTIKKKMKKVNLFISMQDGSVLSFTKNKHVEITSSAVKAWFELYKWFVFRESSEIYSFHYDTGCVVFKKKDIKTIKFEEIEVEV